MKITDVAEQPAGSAAEAQKSPKKRLSEAESMDEFVNKNDNGDERQPSTPRKRTQKATGYFTPVNPGRVKRPPDSPCSPAKIGGYTASDDMLILTLRGSNLPWEEVATYFEGRSATAVRLHHDKVLKSIDLETLAKNAHDGAQSSKGYTQDQDRLLTMLKEVKKMKWGEMARFFPGRSATAIRLHYAKIKKSPGE